MSADNPMSQTLGIQGEVAMFPRGAINHPSLLASTCILFNAVTVLKPGLDPHQVLARFEVERQAMAMMNRSIPQRPQVTQAAPEPVAEAIQILDILQTTGA